MSAFLNNYSSFVSQNDLMEKLGIERLQASQLSKTACKCKAWRWGGRFEAPVTARRHLIGGNLRFSPMAPFNLSPRAP